MNIFYSLTTLFLLTLLLPLVGAAQTKLPLDESGKVTFTEVIEVPNVSQSELHTRAHVWLATSFSSANEVILMNNRESGQLIGKGITTLRSGEQPSKLHFTLHLQFKDGRYRWEMTNLAYSVGDAKSTAEDILSSKHTHRRNGELRPLPQQLVDDTPAAVARLQESLTQALQELNSSTSDW